MNFLTVLGKSKKQSVVYNCERRVQDSRKHLGRSGLTMAKHYVLYGAKYSRMNQVRFVEDSL